MRPPGTMHGRLRRRGPRSAEAIIRRARGSQSESASVTTSLPHGDDPCKSGLMPPSVIDKFTILHHNIRGFLSHRDELEILLYKYEYPSFVGLVETFLDDSIQAPALTNYELLARKDRGGLRQKGGVILFVRNDLAKYAVQLGNSESAERVWVLLHSDLGPILIGLWYRPPCYGEVGSIQSLDAELAKHGSNVLGTILCGDMNVHHSTWLQFSHSITPEGRALYGTSMKHNFTECTKHPTRNKYLLDLTLSTFEECTSTKVVPGVSDHNIVLCNMALPAFSDSSIARSCFDHKNADWKGLNNYFRSTNWHNCLGDVSSSIMVQHFTDYVMEAAKTFIRHRTIQVRKDCHPWLNERCKKLVLTKHDAYGSDSFESLREKCSLGLYEEYMKYVGNTRGKFVSKKSEWGNGGQCRERLHCKNKQCQVSLH